MLKRGLSRLINRSFFVLVVIDFFSEITERARRNNVILRRKFFFRRIAGLRLVTVSIGKKILCRMTSTELEISLSPMSFH